MSQHLPQPNTTSMFDFRFKRLTLCFVKYVFSSTSFSGSNTNSLYFKFILGNATPHKCTTV